jgi:hypothetical protein
MNGTTHPLSFPTEVVVVPDTTPPPEIPPTTTVPAPRAEHPLVRIVRCTERTADVANGRITDPAEIARVAREAAEHLRTYLTERRDRERPTWLSSVDVARLRGAVRGVFGDGEAHDWIWTALRRRLCIPPDPEEERRMLEDRVNRVVGKRARGPTTLGKRTGTSRVVWHPST